MVNVVTDKEFEEQVLKAEKPVLIDFWAEWCSPCRMVAPIVEEIAREYQDKIDVYKLDVDANIDTAFRYQVQSIPTLILFKNGKPAERIIGFRPKDRLVAQLEPHLS
ncbi:MAG: thioredoxin [Chloroflexi bacterium]|nr:thioredoxin [Chloroflexota bacterium]MCL5947084.1 thioredoxin [Chloroflexota bacterium]